MTFPTRAPAPFLVSAAFAAFMVACGGGSSESSAPAPAAPSPARAPPSPVPAPPSPAPPAPVPAADVAITLTPPATRTISPYIHGMDFYAAVANAPPLPTLDRAGGDRWTAYPWENNASNAGSDYLYESDNYLSNSAAPAEAVRALIAGDRAAGSASLVTLKLQSWAAAGENGPVSPSSPPDTMRFKPLV